MQEATTIPQKSAAQKFVEHMSLKSANTYIKDVAAESAYIDVFKHDKVTYIYSLIL